MNGSLVRLCVGRSGTSTRRGLDHGIAEADEADERESCPPLRGLKRLRGQAVCFDFPRAESMDHWGGSNARLFDLHHGQRSLEFERTASVLRIGKPDQIVSEVVRRRYATHQR